jgi:hypothetical protein
MADPDPPPAILTVALTILGAVLAAGIIVEVLL